MKLPEKDGADIADRIKSYLDTIPSSTSGEHGDDMLYYVANICVHGWAQDHESSTAWLNYYNLRSKPKWPDHRIKYKIDQAFKCTNHKKDKGHLIGDDSTSWTEYSTSSPNDKKASEANPESKTEVFNGFDLIAKFPQLREPIIDGICRRGEIVNLIASPKTGKSWMALSMCLAVSAGKPWLCFPTTKTPVLLIDNELHPEVIASRLMHVAVDMDMKPEQIDILPLRGRGFDIHKIKYALSIIEKGKYGLIVIDSLYRTWPKGTDENSNSDVTSFYNLVDEIADRVNATILLIHHTTKGSQGDRGTTDVGSGAGAISRAADTHLIIRPHSEPDMAVLDAVCRSFPSVDQFTIQFKFPIWSANEDLPPVLAGRNGSDDEASKERIRGDILFALGSVSEPLSAYQLAEFVADCSDGMLKSTLADLVGTARIRRLEVAGRGGKLAFTYTAVKEEF